MITPVMGDNFQESRGGKLWKHGSEIVRDIRWGKKEWASKKC